MIASCGIVYLLPSYVRSRQIQICSSRKLLLSRTEQASSLRRRSKSSDEPPSEISNKMEKLIIISSRNPCPDVVAATASTYADKAAARGGGSEVETVRCACCGVTEDCTATYIGGVRAAFCGDWVCGLCAEAVKERMRRDPAGGVEAALGSHEAECRDFNATTRLNPTLSLAGSMRDIARRSFDRRKTTSKSCQDRHLRAAASKAVALARSVSCDTRFLADVIINNNGPAGDRCR